MEISMPFIAGRMPAQTQLKGVPPRPPKASPTCASEIHPQTRASRTRRNRTNRLECPGCHTALFPTNPYAHRLRTPDTPSPGRGLPLRNLNKNREVLAQVSRLCENRPRKYLGNPGKLPETPAR